MTRLPLFARAPAVLAVAMAAWMVVACGSSSQPAQSEGRARYAGELFARDTSFAVGQAPGMLAAGDFDGDGTTDIAVADLLGHTVSIVYSGPDDGLFRLGAAIQDTAFADTLGYIPTALVASDVNADGRMDLVAAFNRRDAQDDVPIKDRIIVLTNGGDRSYAATFDTMIAGRDITDLFVGGVDAADGRVHVVAANSVKDEPVVHLARAAAASPRRAQNDGTWLELVGTLPADKDTAVATNSAVTAWFTMPVPGAVDSLKLPLWVRMSGDAGGSKRDIPIASAAKAPTQVSAPKNQYVLFPARPFLPREVVTVVFDEVRGQPTTSTPYYSLERPDSISFTTEDLTVVETLPADGDVSIEFGAQVVIMFNGALDPVTVVGGAFSMTGRDGRNIPVVADYVDSNWSVTLTPSEPFVAYESVTVNATNAVRDSLGRETFAGYTFGFLATGPRVIAVLPEQGSVSSTPNDLALKFNTAMSEVPPAAIVVYGSISGYHTVTLPARGPDRSLVGIVVDGAFYAGETVTVTATSHLESEDEYALAKPHVWSYVAQPTFAASLAAGQPAFTVEEVSHTVVAANWFGDEAGVVLVDTSGSLVVAAYDAASGLGDAVEGVALDTGVHLVRAADVDADGLSDLVVVTADSDMVRVFRNTTQGELAFSEGEAYLVGVSPREAFIGDLNGDGMLDVATVNHASNDVSVLLNLGDGTFADEVYYPVDNHPRAVIGADLDGDGDTDLVVAATGYGGFTLLRNVTSTTSQPPVATITRQARR